VGPHGAELGHTLGLDPGSGSHPVVGPREAGSHPVVEQYKKEKNIYGKLPLADEPIEPATDGREKEDNKLDPEWTLDDDWRQWSKGKCGFTDPAVDKLAEDFRNFWTSSDRGKPGKREWFAIWQDWSFFEAFWWAYPAERRQNKADVRQTFFAIIAGKHKSLSRATPEVLIENARRYNRRLKDRKFAKMPSTWLNNGCWEDEGNQPQENAGTKPNDPYEMPEYNPAWDNNPLGEDCPS
jgi:hypothetical protein